MKVLSLFDGMSVAQQALKNMGADIEVYYASEIDEPAISVTQSNYPDTKQLGDISQVFAPKEGGITISNKTINGIMNNAHLIYNHQDIDLLIGGSPCQDLSIAKKNREGLEGSKSSLFYEYLRIRNQINPKYFILENVASMPKHARDIISKELGVEPIMINAGLVSAQNRKRLFWVGKLNDWGGYDQVDIKLPEDSNIFVEDILESDVSEEYFITGNFLTWITGEQGKKRIRKGFIKINPEKAKVLMARDYANWSGNFIFIPEATKKGYAIAFDGDSIDLSFLDSKTRRGRVGKKVKNLMTSQNIAVFKNGILRKLTPTECLRLQSMPDDYFDKAEYKGKPISNTQRYKMCGNAFNCAVIEHILESILK